MGIHLILMTAVFAATSSTQTTHAQNLSSNPLPRVDLLRSGGNINPNPVHDSDSCSLTVENQSIAYFRNQLETNEPHFIHFELNFTKSDVHINATKQAVKPNKWVWTYKSANGLNPYIFWNIDYSILSFGLLDAKTLNNGMQIYIDASPSCSITFGSPDTTNAIAHALKGIIEEVTKDQSTFLVYEESYFCYLVEVSYSHESVGYQFALYFLYPIRYINYQCCHTYHMYSNNTLGVDCDTKPVPKWTQCIIGPYILGIIIFLYFPILMFQWFSWISSYEVIEPTEYDLIASSCNVSGDETVGRSMDGWILLNGQAPYKFTDLLSHVWCGLDISWPIAVSRIRRLLMVWVVIPAGVYIQLLVYYYTQLDNTKVLVEHRTPLGLLSLLGNARYQSDVFVPILGGPWTIIYLFYSTGLLFVVLPRSLKQIVEDGMPTRSSRFKSPLFLGVGDIKRLSMIEGSMVPGYVKGMTVFKCGIYMMFSKTFWKFVFNTQIQRMFDCNKKISMNVMFFLKLVALPFYISLCLLESLLCILMYGIPLCMATSIMFRGAKRSLGSFRTSMSERVSSHLLRKLIFDNPVLRLVVFLGTAALVILYSYAVCLVFIETFQFISQVIVFCFVAVIVFPSVAFGYLFFFVVLSYYIFRRVRDFGDGYLELLSDAVEICRNLDGQPNYVTFVGDTMMISNLKAPHNLKYIRINSATINPTRGELDFVFKETLDGPKIKLVDNVYAIPRDLFDFLVMKHRPAHEQVVKITFNIALLVVLVFMTMSITIKYVSGPSSDISEVMHVIFIVVVGALPRVLEVAMTSSSETILREIELRNLERTVLEYWRDKQN